MSIMAALGLHGDTVRSRTSHRLEVVVVLAEQGSELIEREAGRLKVPGDGPAGWVIAVGTFRDVEVRSALVRWRRIQNGLGAADLEGVTGQ